MKELQKVVNYWEVFQPEYDEPLLEYVGILAEKYQPLTEDGKENGYWFSIATGVFAQKYLQDKIDKSKLNEYLRNKEIQSTLKLLDYDEEKFWYLLLFIDDFAKGVCKEGINLNDSPKRQIENLLKVLSGNTTESIKIVVEGVKPKIEINNPTVIKWITNVCNREFEKNELMYNQIEYSPLADGKQMWFFAKMFFSFFELVKPKKVKLMNSDLSTNKKLFVSRLIYFMGLSPNENFLVSDDSLKGILSQYKDLEVNRINVNYL